MKRRLLFLALLFVGLVGCTYNTLPDDVATPVVATEQGFDLSFATRAEVFDGQSLDNTYFVAEEDLESYLNYKQQHSGKKITVKDYSAYGFDGSHTLFYVLNYDNGWEVVSADKRTQATLAYGESGSFSMGADNTNEAEKLWMKMLASNVLQKRQRGGTKDGARLTDENQAHVDYWDFITNAVTSRGFIDGPVYPGDPTFGYTYVVGVVSDTTHIQQGPFLRTAWGQEDPWNIKCPDRCDEHNMKAPAGCVSVAGGQLLYYLQQKYGARFPIPISCSVTGNTISHQFYFSNTLTSATWGAMALTEEEEIEGWDDGPTQLVATALAWIGDRVNMDYGDGYSYASSDSLMYNVFSHLGVTWERHDGYNYTILADQLCEEKRPVYIDASTNLNSGGHVWIIDGYSGEQIKKTVYYINLPTPMDPNLVSQIYDIEDGTPGTPTISLTSEMVHFNWGYDGSNSGYYGILPADWEPEEAPAYQHDVKIYYNFSPTILLSL